MKTFVLIALVLASCNKRDTPDNAAKEFCQCVATNQSNLNVKSRNASCINQILPYHRLLRIGIINIQYNKGLDTISMDDQHKAGIYILNFQNKIDSSCCQIAFEGCGVKNK